MIRRLPIPMGLLDPQVDDVRTPFDYSAPSLNAAKKRDWRASLFDRFVPQGDANMSDEDKSRSTRQGLLQLAIGLQSSNNFGESLAKGLSGGLLSMNQGVDDMQTRQYKQQLLAARTGDPTEFRALDMQAKAAGYEPGTPGYQHFMRVRGGLESKASNAGYKFEQVPGADGKTRIQRSNPNTGEVEIYDEQIGDFVPVGQSSVPSTGVPVPAPTTGGGSAMMGDAIQSVESAGNPNAVSPAGARGLMQLMPATAREIEAKLGMPAGLTDRDPEANRKAGEFYYQEQLKRFGDPQLALAAYNGGPNRLAGHLGAVGGNPNAAIARMPAETRAYVPKVMARANPGLVVGRPKEAEAAAVEGAKIDATNARAGASARTAAMQSGAVEGAKIDAFLRNTGQVGDAEATVEAKKVAAKATAERQQEAIGNLPTADANADQMLALINKAIKHPGRTAATGLSSWNPLNKVPGTDAKDFAVLQDQIKGRTFLEAFNSLKGGGQITENEGKKAEQAIARLDASQSEGEYLQALKDLQGVVNNARMRARKKAGAKAPASGEWSIRVKGQ